MDLSLKTSYGDILKIAVMQPYFYPYIEYFRLIASVDVFVFFTDVQYIRRGWINRNRIRSSHTDWQYIVVPVKRHRRFTKILNIEIFENKWKQEILKKLLHNYGKKIYDHPVVRFLECYNGNNLCHLNMECIKNTCGHIGINTTFINSLDFPSTLTHQDRIIDICKKTGATIYFNAINGKNIYNTELFRANGIELKFIEHSTCANKFSILDLILSDEFTNDLLCCGE